MRWPWSRPEAPAPAPEERASYTDQVVAAIIARAEGSGAADASATAALEAASGLYARCFAVARVEGRERARALLGLSGGVLAGMARSLIRHGQSLHVIDVARGRLRLWPSSGWDVTGVGPDPEGWTYRADVPTPGGLITRTYPAASVVHLRYAVTPSRPWEGVSPLAWASETGKLAGALEGALANEAAGPHGHLLTIPAAGEAAITALKAQIKTIKGQAALLETTASGYGESRASAPRRDWQPERLGADPPPAVSLRTKAAEAVLAACGVPPELFSGDGQGTAAREAFRRFLHGSLMGVARMVEEETTTKLEARVRLNFDPLMAADLSGRARAFQSLVGGGMGLAEAAALAGLLTRR